MEAAGDDCFQSSLGTVLKAEVKCYSSSALRHVSHAKISLLARARAASPQIRYKIKAQA